MSEYFGDIVSKINKFELGTKIRSETGDVYNLCLAENEQRKFSRWNGTKLRFMTYENIGKKFEILEDNTEEIEELDLESLNGMGGFTFTQIEEEAYSKINELIKAVNEIRRKKDGK